MLGLIYDVHGNRTALEAVLADAASVGVERFLLGGDYALNGPDPAGTVGLLRSLDAAWIRGNTERWTADPSSAPDFVQGALSVCRELLGEELVAELAALPQTHEEMGVLFCHASPRSDMHSFLPDPDPDESELLEGVGARRIVFGHTHRQFRRTTAEGIELVNPGSAGMPWDGDHRAAWAVLRDDGGIDLRRVAYDHMAAASALRETLGKHGDAPARRLEQARFDVS